MRQNFENDGFELFPPRLGVTEFGQLKEIVKGCFAEQQKAAGLRGLLRRNAELNAFAIESSVSKLAAELLGTKVLAVRAILFDKTPDSNWYVTWHQDLTIPVLARRDTPGFTAWSVKDEVVHVQPPAEILEKMVSLRIHLDASPAENGPIKFIPGSHQTGILSHDQIEEWKLKNSAVTCPAAEGEIIAMRPLILHSSSASQFPAHRRVLHIEYTGTSLPAGLDWAQA